MPRHLTPVHRALLFALLALAIAVRAAVPAGWMPMADVDGVTRLVLCPAGDPARPGVTTAGSAMPGMAMPGMAVGASSQGRHHDPATPAADHECPFGVAALAVDLAAPPLDPIAPAMPVVRVDAPSPVLLPGRGLAAPPPPATGPPLLA